jgi:hypothetical protein
MTSDARMEDEHERSAASSLFDLRYLIGSLFTFYGVVLTIASFFVSHAKSGSVDINLWLGLAMFVVGLVFLGWARWRPLHVGGRSAAAQLEDADGPPPR